VANLAIFRPVWQPCSAVRLPLIGWDLVVLTAAEFCALLHHYSLLMWLISVRKLKNIML